MSLVEVTVAMAMLAIGLLSAAMTALRCSKLQQSTAHWLQAHQTSRAVLEDFRTDDLVTAYQAAVATPAFVVAGQTVQIRFPEAALIDALGAVPSATAMFQDVDADGLLDLVAGAADPAGILAIEITVAQDELTFTSTSVVASR